MSDAVRGVGGEHALPVRAQVLDVLRQLGLPRSGRGWMVRVVVPGGGRGRVEGGGDGEVSWQLHQEQRGRSRHGCGGAEALARR